MGRPKEVTDTQILNAARRCFLKRGAGVSALEIGRELGVSHTTLFNRFGSKEELMVAALGPPAEVPWVLALKEDPDARPIREQLVAHASEMATYFQELHAGFGVLQAAGIDPKKAYMGCGESGPEQAYRAFVGWIQRAQAQGRIAMRDPEALASTIIGTLQGWAFTARVCRTARTSSADHVEQFVDILWNGIRGKKA